MKLYLLRHGPAGDRNAWKDDDAKRPLTKRGKKKMRRIAKTIARWRLGVDLIISSPYLRAAETAEIVARKLKLQDKLVRDDCLAYGFNMEKLTSLLGAFPKAEAIMFVGHEPDFSQTIGYLTGGSRVVVKKGGLACVDLPDRKALKGELLWLVPPRLMA